MFKKITIILIFFCTLQACGFTPIYSKNKNLNFVIEEIKLEGDDSFNKLIEINLKNREFSKKDNNKKIRIEVKTDYSKNSIEKDITGNTLNYELVASVKFYINSESFEKTFNIEQKSLLKNLSNKNEEKKNEENLKQIMAEGIIDKLLLNLLYTQ